MRKETDELTLEESLKANPHQPAAWCSLGEIRLRSRRLPEARTAFENALRMDGSSAQPHFGLASVCKQEGKPADAIASYRNGLRQSPDNGQVLLDLGVLLAEQGTVDEAIDCWQKLLCLEPQHFHAHHNLGVAMAQKDKPEEAIRDLQHALTLRPDYAEAHFNPANVLFNQKTRENDQRPDGIEHYFQAIRLRPNYIKSLFNLGCVLTDLKRAPEATIWLEQAARLGEANTPCHHLTSSAYNHLGLSVCMQARYREAQRQPISERCRSDPTWPRLTATWGICIRNLAVFQKH
jgi:tetratricopeptide (TPR) repeat protein